MSEREESRRGGSALDAGELDADVSPIEVEPTRRTMKYCIVPEELANNLHELLREHFRGERDVEVVVERRWRDRRSEVERRSSTAKPKGEERRKVIAASGRRVADRRARVAEVETPELPRRARRHANRLLFVEREEPAAEEAEDRDTARLIARYQAGEHDTYAILYQRYYDRVYGYARLVLSDHYEAEDITQQVFVKLLEALPSYERRSQPFRAWLFIAVRNAAISHLRKTGRLIPEDPQGIAGHLERTDEGIQSNDQADDYENLAALGWIADRDLLLFVERLPEPQQQVLTLRYVLDLPAAEIAQMLGRTPEDVRKLQHRALIFLRDRLAAVGRAPSTGARPMGWKRRPTQVKVLRDRRFALMK